MEFSRGKRLTLLVFLLIALSALLIVGGIDRPPAPELGVYPGADDIAHHPDTHLNQQVSFTGQVVSTDPLIIRADYETDAELDSIRITLTDVDADIERGDTLQVVGVLTDPRTVRPTNVVVVPRTGLWYAWVTSFAAGLWVLARLLRHWRLDTETGAFHPNPKRDGGNN